MEINQPMLGILINQKRAINEKTQLEIQQEALLGYSVVDKDDKTIQALVEANSNSTIYEIADKIAIKNSNSASSTSLKNASTDLAIKSGLSISLGDLDKSQIMQIKQVIYDLHHPKPVIPDPVIPPAEGDDDGDSDPDPVVEPVKTTFIDEFDDVDSMFEWLNTQDSTITKQSGLSAKQLWNLTQRDDWEESHYYFFGQLNKIFSKLDENTDKVLSYEELKKFMGNEMGALADYYTKVQQYANQIQSYFSTLTKQEKLEFIINMSREYFGVAGLSDQTKALDRLIALNKIQFKDLNDGDENGTTLGMYVYMINTIDDSWNNDSPENCGMFIDSSLIDDSSTQWYDLVDVMVHEVTHATAYLHPKDYSQWGEHVAYQIDEDYLDSVGSGYWKGSTEADKIRSHILNNYGEEEAALEPSWRWWSYA